MASKKKIEKLIEYEKSLSKTKILKINVEEEMKVSFISYAMAVNVSRAIPDVRDGLKPVHRRILYAMSELNLFADKPYRKCARIVGDVLGKYHPHGDSAVYEALVRLAQDFSIRYPLVDGQGNFGSVDGDPAAAQRYTEAKLAKISSELLKDIDKQTVDFYPNFDGTEMQPAVLPSRFPNLLVNGADGIAVGMATNIPPHNLGEVINGCIALLENPEITIDELMKYIPAPDYPTAGVLLGTNGIKRAYKTGKGNFILRAKTEIEENSSGRQQIIITELPYQVNKAKLIETIAGLVKDKKVEGIADVQEESDRQGMRIVIPIKKDYNASVVLNHLYKHSQLQTSGGITFLALVNNEPKILNLKEMVFHYTEHQKEIITRRTRFDLERAEEREHIVAGLVIAQAHIDEVIKIIKQSSDRAQALEKLVLNFELSEKQANAILEMKLSRLTGLEVDKLKAELEELGKTILRLKEILGSERIVCDIVKSELLEIKERFADERRTRIEVDYSEINYADLIEVEDVVISMTHTGYIKRLPLSEYKSQNRGGTGVMAHKSKEEDFVENMFITSTHDHLLFFSNLGKVYRIKGYDVPEASRQARGRAIVNLLNLSPGEKINTIIPMKEDCGNYLVMATKQGLIKKTDMKEFDSIRIGGKIAILLNDDDELISTQLSDGNQDILVASRNGKCIRFNENDVRPTGRGTHGVRSIRLQKSDYVVDMSVIKEGYDVITVSENGFGKRMDISDFRLQSRGGSGIKAGTFTSKTGKLVNMKLVSDDEDIMIIADNGTIIRMASSSISRIGRATQGVRMMRIKGEGKVASFAIAPHEDEQPENSEIDPQILSEIEVSEGNQDFSSETETVTTEFGEIEDLGVDDSDDDEI